MLCRVFNKTTDHDDGFLDLYHLSSWGADCSLLLNADLQRIIDQQTEPWGVKVTAVEVKNVDLPQEMQRAVARRSFTLKANS
ncbi:MAG TPA: SPFH domain-containing protein, partial [Nitrospiraceae bacterium]